ncbi:Alpha/Beta hydrolase protein [Apodospora peruviana]|uniref:Alpha/Beta hydrolase protein n=1 Tax=Apodospora peruviana TaxID=516989 RepID=A0AAE0MFL0_9PEZI|nr:Alpha/Beta hydrolase protein [Apodospora peruviana]
MASIGNWSFIPLVSAFPTTVFPNIALWNVTNAVTDLTYQIEISWPFEWGSSPPEDVSNKTALTMYVVDGNALGMTASEGFKRRKPVASTQPDSVVVSIGYPLTDNVYALNRRVTDFRPPLPTPQVPPSGADPFIEFIDGALRPWVRSTVFPGVSFMRDALYGHSFGGLFVIYALISHPSMFDTFLSASPAITWNNGSIRDDVSSFSKLGNHGKKKCHDFKLGKGKSLTSQPAFVVSYGTLEQFPVKRRTETEEEYEARKAFYAPFKMTDYCKDLYRRLKGSCELRDVVLKEYAGQDHSSVGASALNDGIEYFVDW